MSKNQSVVSSKVETIQAKLQLIVCPDKVDDISVLVNFLDTYSHVDGSGDHIKEEISVLEGQVLRDEVIFFLRTIDRNVSALMTLTIEQLTLLSNKLRDMDNGCLTSYGEVIKDLIIDKKTGAVVANNFGVFDIPSDYLHTCMILLNGIQKEKSFQPATTPEDLVAAYSKYNFWIIWKEDFERVNIDQMAELLCLFKIRDLIFTTCGYNLFDRYNQSHYQNKIRCLIYRFLKKGFHHEGYNNKKSNLRERVEALQFLLIGRPWVPGQFQIVGELPVVIPLYRDIGRRPSISDLWFDRHELFPKDGRGDYYEQRKYLSKAAWVSCILLAFYRDLGKSELRKKRDELMAFDVDMLKEFVFFCSEDDERLWDHDGLIENRDSHKVLFEYIGEKGLQVLEGVRHLVPENYAYIKNTMKYVLNWDPDEIRKVLNVSVLFELSKIYYFRIFGLERYFIEAKNAPDGSVPVRKVRKFKETPFVYFTLDQVALSRKEASMIEKASLLCRELSSTADSHSELLAAPDYTIDFMLEHSQLIRRIFPNEFSRVKECLDFLKMVSMEECVGDQGSDCERLTALYQDKLKELESAKQASGALFNGKPVLSFERYFIETISASDDSSPICRVKKFKETPFVYFTLDQVESSRKEPSMIERASLLCRSVHSTADSHCELLAAPDCAIDFMLENYLTIIDVFPNKLSRVKECLDFLGVVPMEECADDQGSREKLIAVYRNKLEERESQWKKKERKDFYDFCDWVVEQQKKGENPTVMFGFWRKYIRKKEASSSFRNAI